MKNNGLIILGILVGIGFILRIWGTAGVYIRADDHLQILQADVASNEYFEADLGYPVFYQYVGGFILRALNTSFHIIGAVDKGFKKEWTYVEVAIIMRILSGFYGAMSILFTYLIAKKLFSEQAALLSSFFLTFAYFHILTGHTALLDNQMGFFVLLGFLFMIGIAKKGKTAQYLLAGLMTGFAVSSKYNAVFLVFTLFLSHVVQTYGKKKLWKVFVDKNIIFSGIFVIFGFLLGNPPVWMAFKRWSGKIFGLGRLIRQQDNWMVELKFSNIWDLLRYNKYTSAFLNIHYSIKISLFILFLVGLFRLMKRHKKEDFLLLSFPLFSIILGLGVFAITRPRDHFALIPFYIIIASLGFLWIIEISKKLFRAGKVHVVVFPILLLLSSYPSFKTTSDLLHLFHERDTCEYGEDWIYENIPPRSRNVYETYTSFIHTPRSKYHSIFPDRFQLGAHFIMGSSLKEDPYAHLRRVARFVHISNFHPRRFVGLEKYYKRELRFYKRIFREFKLVKKFALKEIESKSPTQYIFTTKNLPLKENPLIFPEQLSLIQRQRDIFFDDPGYYGKSNLIFVLEGRGHAGRKIVSRKEIKEIVVFLYGSEGDKVRISNQELTLDPAGFGFLLFDPVKKTYPFSEPAYSVKVKSLAHGPVLVKIHYEQLKTGYEFFKNGMWEAASRCFSAALEENPDNADALLYLRETRKRMGAEIEELSGRDRNRVHSIFSLQDMESWMRRMEKLTSMDVEFLVDSLSLYLEMEDLSADGMIVHDPRFLNRKALLATRNSRLDLPFFLPQHYTATITVFDPEGRPASDLKILSEDRVWTPTKMDDVGDSFWRIEIPFRKGMDKASLEVDVKNSFLILDSIWIRPDMQKFFLEKKEELSFLSLAERP